MISVFTPSHDTEYLYSAYDSLKEQTYVDWEWVVLLNGKHSTTHLMFDDDRVRVYKTNATGIGALKAEAVSLCKGDILVELDHDDELTRPALQIIADSFARKPEAVFLYSDTVQIGPDGRAIPDEFSADYGWSYYNAPELDRLGRAKAARSFPPYPHNVSYIWYAPNHVRAFRRDAYEAVGGYDKDLVICDDQDLMAKLYQHGQFFKVNTPLYLQRVHDGNTQRDPDTNAAIQVQTQALYHRDIEPNALAWTKRNGLLALDLGAFHNKREGYLGVDMRENDNVDYVCDFMDLDLPDGSVGVIRAVDFLEHVPDRIGVMNKIWRLLAHGGMLLSDTPSTEGRGAWQDPTHVSGWNENSFWYFTDDNYRKYIESEAKFQTSLLYTYFPSEWNRKHQIPYVRANLIAVKKEGRDFGGPVGI